MEETIIYSLDFLENEIYQDKVIKEFYIEGLENNLLVIKRKDRACVELCTIFCGKLVYKSLSILRAPYETKSRADHYITNLSMTLDNNNLHYKYDDGSLCLYYIPECDAAYVDNALIGCIYLTCIEDIQLYLKDVVDNLISICEEHYKNTNGYVLK